MTASFIEVIRDALIEYDNNQQDGQYYEYMAWGALTDTDAFTSALGSKVIWINLNKKLYMPQIL